MVVRAALRCGGDRPAVDDPPAFPMNPKKGRTVHAPPGDDDLFTLFVSALRSDVARIEGVVMRHASEVRGIVGIAFADILATFRVRA